MNNEMKNGYYVAREEVEGMIIELAFEDEHIPVTDVYDENDEYGKEDIQNIIDGKYTWACAFVTCYKNGIKLAYTTLGCCEYDWSNIIEEFKANGCYDDMKAEVIAKAKQTIAQLVA